MPLPLEIKQEAGAILSRYEQKRAAILPLLHLFQDRYGYISDDSERDTAEYLEIPLIDVREVLSFYTLLRRKPAGKTCLNVCRTLSCSLRGKNEIIRLIQSSLGIKPGETTPDGRFTLNEVECLGACEQAPMMQVNDDYVGCLTKEKVEALLRDPETALRSGMAARPPAAPSPENGILSKFFDGGQTFFLEDYIKQGGYEAARRMFEKWTPKALIDEVKKSNLRGLGGAGFPAGMKWSFVPQTTGKPVYLVVNGDEGEPGTFKDKYILTHSPHLLLEGILIASYANQAHKAFVYIRGEYKDPIEILNRAIQEAEAKNLLGKNILGKNFDLEVVVHRGAGAYIAGEETGLLESLEGKKAFPRLKPPFPAVVGLFGCPTVINNVETLSYLPSILKLGSEKFAGMGSPKNGGMRLYSVSGHIQKPGVYERPLGYPLRKLIEDAGGVREGHQLKAVVPGGLSAAVLKPEEIEVGLDFDQLHRLGTMAGSAGVMVLDDSVCMVESLYVTMNFYAHESCGQCSPCREGTGWVAKILRRIYEGHGRKGDIDTLIDISKFMGGTTICALADGACMPLGSYLQKFRGEFEFHIQEKRCNIEKKEYAYTDH